MVVRVLVDSVQVRRRRALLKALNAPTDGPTQLTTQTMPIAPRAVRRASAVAVTARWSAVALLLALGVIAALVRAWFVLGVLPVPLMVLLVLPPVNEERWRVSVQHGRDGRYLSVRTLSGIRSLDLSRVCRVVARSDAVWAVDADGVTVKLRSQYARRALMSGVDRWGLAPVSQNPAARRALARHLWHRMLLHPLRTLRDPWA